MSTESRQTALLAGLGADVKNLQGLPAWADRKNRSKRFNPETGAFNARQGNLRRTRIALAKAASRTGKLNIITMGDSALIGYNGSVTKERASLPRQLATSLAKMSGAPLDSGLALLPSATNTLNDRWVLTGTYFLSYPFLMMGAAATATYESELPGTSVEIYYTDNSGAFTYSIDGAAAVTVTPTGGAGCIRLAVTGLSNTTHRITITANANYVYLVALGVLQTTGISQHNLAYGGSRASVDINNSWTTGTAGTSLKMSREILRQTTGFPDPDLIIIGIGANDVLQGDPYLGAIDGIRTMRNWFPNADCVITGGVFFAGADPTLVANYSAAKYALAEELDCTYIDSRDALKDAAYALAQGALGADNAHPIDGISSESARAMASIVSGSGAPCAQTTPPVVHLKVTAAPVVSTAMVDQFVRCSSASAQALTVPPNSADPIPIGSTIEGQQYGAGLVTITPGAGVTLRSSAGLKVNGQYGVFGLRKIGTDEWSVYGDLTT